MQQITTPTRFLHLPLVCVLLIVLWILPSASAEAARVMKFTASPTPTVEVDFYSSSGGRIQVDLQGTVEVVGQNLVDEVVSVFLATQPLPRKLELEGRWVWQGPFNLPQTNAVHAECQQGGLLGASDCSFENGHTFTALPPDTVAVVRHDLTAAEKGIGWSAIEVSVSGEVSLSLGAGGSAGGQVTLVVEDSAILVGSEDFPWTKPTRTGSCPDELPVWDYNQEQCDICPQEKPVWDPASKTCRSCPDGQEYDGEKCVDNAPPNCPDRMTWNEEQQECICQDGFYPYRDTPYSPLECLRPFELRPKFPNSGTGGDPIVARPPGDGVLWVLRCQYKDTFDCIDIPLPDGSIVVDCSRKKTLVCEWTPIKLKHEAVPGPNRRVCHYGLGWQACPDDPLPGVPMPAYPDLDLLGVFGACHAVGPVQVTPCASGGASPSSTLPDLEVSLLSFENSTLRPGDAIELRVEVVNRGGVTAANSVLWIHWTPADGTTRFQRLWIGSLAPGQSRSLSARSDSTLDQPFTAMAGTLSVRASADGENTLDEANEANNERSTSRWIATPSGGGPNLRPSWIQVTPQHPVEGSLVTLQVAVDNTGDQPAPAAAHRIRVARPGGVHTVDTRSTPSLAPGEEWTSQLVVPVPDPGAYTVTVETDVLDGVIETSELDNTHHRQFTVAGDTTCLPCTTGSPQFVGAEVCLDSVAGVPADGERWRCQGVRFDGSSCVANGNHPNGWQFVGPRCPPPESLCAGTLHADRCGTPGLCPGALDCS
ncbi:MAG: CARDB domain-containing protein [Acidobacteriota bacterium]